MWIRLSCADWMPIAKCIFRNARTLDFVRLFVSVGAIVIIFDQALLTGSNIIDLESGNAFCRPPSWFAFRALFTTLAFYSALAAQRFSRRATRWIVVFLGVLALFGSSSYPIWGTEWGLPVFVGGHLVAILLVNFRAIRLGKVGPACLTGD